ncbi:MULTISPECIES: hypothetical protein [Natrialbaceae]|uniref:hypothetical protein n=1 Tax=Natrialbaceae TaxID=1644061 RepID=UPI00207CB15A|nr:hypothetical protein [Natronococcus sp. CG52]
MTDRHDIFVIAGRALLVAPLDSSRRCIHTEKRPVCGEELHEGEEERIGTLSQGKNHHFCSTDHRDEFEEQPGTYM